MHARNAIKCRIDDQISKEGVFVAAITFPGTDGLLKSPENGVVFTIGRKNKNCSDIVILCGPCYGQPPMTQDEMNIHLDNVKSAIIEIVSEWGDDDSVAVETLRNNIITINGRKFVVASVLEENVRISRIYHGMVIDYYDEEYDLLQIIPIC